MMDNREMTEGVASADPDENIEKDATMAMIMSTVEKLTMLFGFDLEIASRAVEAIEDKSDYVAACNWILDHGGQDKGGPVVPIINCPHVENHVKISPDMILICEKCDYMEAVASGQECEETILGSTVISGKTDKSISGACPSTENWVCLECNASRCSRYVNGHSLQHATATGHSIAVSLSDLSAWCYECEAYVTHPCLDPLLARLNELKFSSGSASS